MAISNCIEKDNAIHVYDENGQEINYFYFSGSMLGFSEMYIFTIAENSIVNGSKIISIITEKGYPQKSFYINNPDQIYYNSESIICRYGNEQFTYDINGDVVDRLYV